MVEPTPRFWEVFFDVYEGLPRQGPGNRANAKRALEMCTDLPPEPAILDLGCGAGGQTLHLADLSPGTILAVDNHEPLIRRFNERINESGLAHRITAVTGDMGDPAFARGKSFDLVWSEGALYNIGIARALEVCRGLLRPDGYLVFTDAVWRRDNAPQEIRETFDLDYPAMGRVEDILNLIAASAFDLIGHFTLAGEAWWDDFYTPMEERVRELRSKYAHDPEATATLDTISREPEMHRRYHEYYAYEFFVTRATAGRR